MRRTYKLEEAPDECVRERPDTPEWVARAWARLPEPTDQEFLDRLALLRRSLALLSMCPRQVLTDERGD